MKSMTGFGRGEAQLPETGTTLSIEVSSVNRKQLDLRIFLPRELSNYDPIIRKRVTQQFTRGAIRISVELQQSGENAQTLILNKTVAKRLLKAAQELEEELEIKNRVSLKEILSIEGVIETAQIDYEQEEFQSNFLEALEHALTQFESMRQKEGEEMKADLKRRVEFLEEQISSIKPLVADVPEMMKKRLLQRLETNGLELDFSDDRLLKEIVIFSDKSDVSEELTRLDSHIKQYYNFLNADKPVGRSMDFLTQEVLREITTLGNKANSSSLSPIIVEFKTELEKLREQIQNIE
jgi:uncharacterized protein (TIGR00255 family)